MSRDEGLRRASTWAEELQRLNERAMEIVVDRTHLVPGWDHPDEAPWKTLRNERDRILIIKTELGWLSADAAARVDRCLRAASEIIDQQITYKASEAALTLRQAEFLMQQAWRSRQAYRPSIPWIPGISISQPLLISWILFYGLALTAWAIYSEELFPTGEDFTLDRAFTAAAAWGLVGGLVNGLITMQRHIQAQTFEPDRALWYSTSPVIGLVLGAVSYFLFLAGILSAGATLPSETAQVVGEGGVAAARSVDPAPVLVIAVLAGFSQNAFIGALHRLAQRRFGPPSEEETV